MASGGNPCHRHLQPRGKTKILEYFALSTLRLALCPANSVATYEGY